jgi:hypothetical protein
MNPILFIVPLLLGIGIQVLGALWLHRDASARNIASEKWVLLHFFLPLFGMLIYLLVRAEIPKPTALCPRCHRALPSPNHPCPYCANAAVTDTTGSLNHSTTTFDPMRAPTFSLNDPTATWDPPTATHFARLRVSEGRDAGKRYQLNPQTTTFGREPNNTIVLVDAAVSLRQAIIEWDATHKQFVLHDLESKNGTFVNQRRIDRHELKNGDLIQMGNTKLVFEL